MVGEAEMPRRTTSLIRPFVEGLIMTLPSLAIAADAHESRTRQPSTKSTTARWLINVQTALIKSQVTLMKDAYPLFGENFGKMGTLTVETAVGDKFHVTTRSADAFADVAKKLAVFATSESTKADAKLRPVVVGA